MIKIFNLNIFYLNTVDSLLKHIGLCYTGYSDKLTNNKAIFDSCKACTRLKDKSITIPSPSHRANINHTALKSNKGHLVVIVAPRKAADSGLLYEALEPIRVITRIDLRDAV